MSIINAQIIDMVYRKTYKKKIYKKKTGKYSGYNRYKNYANTWSQIKHDVSTLKNLINVEFKTNDINTSQATPTATGNIALMNGLAKGDDYNQRDGRQVRLKSVQGTLEIIKHASAVNTTVRCILVLDKQPNTTSLTLASLLDNTGSVGIVNALRNLDYRTRYWIMLDRKFILDAAHVERSYKYYKKIDIKTVYDDSNDGNVADITSNALYFILLSDEATNTPTINAMHRVRFIDN